MSPSVRRVLAVLALGALSACAESIPSAPSALVGAPKFRSIASDEKAQVSSVLAQINARLEAEGADHRILKAEFLYDGTTWDGASSTVVVANDRWKGIGTEWVSHDMRRGGRHGVTYANALATPLVGTQLQDDRPFTRDPNGANLRPVDYAQLRIQLNEGVTAWSSLSCNRRPVDLVEVADGTNPDFYDDAILGFPFDPDGPNGPLAQQPAARPLPPEETMPYVQAADIVQAGWLGRTFFDRLSPPSGSAGIIGVTLTSVFVSGGQLTDVDNNNLADSRRAEIYYNTRFAWGSTRAANVVDFYSVIAHESGHAFGLNHFGKLFVTKKDAADDGGLSISEIKFAPYAMMNATYITGRNELATLDVSSYCSIFGRELK
jgi:Metallo-peptidase family M12B Reprolysin-like